MQARCTTVLILRCERSEPRRTHVTPAGVNHRRSRRSDVEEDGFLLPILSVQPVVENAVKHGIAKKRGGGVVTISTQQTENAYRIIVSDTGVGFDVDRYMDDGKVHVGLINVRQRLASRMNATVDIDSIPGIGTTVTVTIPREKVNP